MVAALGLGLSVPLIVASTLEPNPLGQGTHQQLGLQPCTVMVLFGCRCPACGMTTSWANLVRGRLARALQANVGGTLLGGLTLAAVPWLLLSAARGHWLGWVPNSTVAAWVASLLMVVMLIDWGLRLIIG